MKNLIYEYVPCIKNSEFEPKLQWRSHWGVKDRKICQKSGKRGRKSGKKSEKRGKNRDSIGKNWEGSFTLPLLTDRAGFATAKLDKVIVIKVQKL